ncbi:MAG TPA: hypothetical protein VMT46_12780 [Anaerolineaceae bacterium]|nr:hypothetical protein [Anaerolineaceae bacterium]
MKSNSFSWSTVVWIAAGILAAVLVWTGALYLQSPSGSSAAAFINALLAADSQQVTWYITRAAGLTAYLVLWLSVAWGLAVPSKILDNLLQRTFTYDFHQFLSLLAIGFITLHIGVLYFDQYLPYSLVQILVPFLSPYRPLWVGLGAISFYLALLVTVTYYIRGTIGAKAFRAIHTLSLVAYLGVTVHALFAGTDSSLPVVMAVYTGTFLATVFLMFYWVYGLAKKRMGGREPRFENREPRTVESSEE